MKSDLMKKNFIWNIIGSTFCTFNSLFFMIIVTRINGVDSAGVFTFAFSTACLLYIIGIYSGRTYQVTDDDLEISDSDYIYSKIFTCLVMLVVGLAFCLIRGYDFVKILIIMELTIFKAMEAFSEGIYAIVQENNELYKVGISLFLKAIISLLLFVIVDILTRNLSISIISIVIVNFMVIWLYDFNNLKKLKFKLDKFNFYPVKKTIIYGFSAFAFVFLTQYVINASKYVIDVTLSNESQTIFGIIIMPATVIVVLGQFVLQPFLLPLKNSLKENKSKFLKMTIMLSCAIIVLGILSLIFIYLFGVFALNILYGINLSKYLTDLLIVIVGATLYEITVILSTSLITMRSTFSQLVVFIIVSIFTYFTSHFMVNKYAIDGAVYTYFLSMLFLLVLYIIIFVMIYRRYKFKGDRK